MILKRQKPGWRKQFDCEVKAYETLRPVQGLFVPICYGQVQYSITDEWASQAQKRRGIILSDLGGWDLSDRDHPLIAPDHLDRMLKEALSVTASLGVKHEDLDTRNVRVVGNRLMLLDWELSSYIGDSETYIQGESESLVYSYQYFRKLWSKLR